MSLRPHRLTQYVFSLAALLLAGSAHAADFELHPSITVNEEFTDNISENDERTLGSEFITRAIPGLYFHYAAPLWVWDTTYTLEYRHYDLNKRDDEDLHNLNTKNRLTLIEEKFFIDISDEYKRVSLDQTRDTTQESLFSNQSDQNNFTVSPNFVLRPTTKIDLRPGASYQKIWYKSTSGVGKNIYSGYLNSKYEITDKFSLISSYVFTLTDAPANIYKTHNLMAGMKLEYSKDSFISIQGGNSWVMTSQQISSNPIWNVAINYASDRYNVRAGTGESYTNDPSSNKITLNTNYEIGFEWTYNLGKLGLSSGIVKLFDVDNNTNFSTSYNNSLSVSYNIFTDIEAHASYSYNYIDISHSNTYTTVSLLNSGITYTYSDNCKINMYYKKLYMYSPDIPVDNKDINNVVLEISKTF